MGDETYRTVAADYRGMFTVAPLTIPAPAGVLRGDVFTFTHDLPFIRGPHQIALTIGGQTRTVPAECEPGLCTITDPATVEWIRIEFWEKRP